jgi:hypothetical protein
MSQFLKQPGWEPNRPKTGQPPPPTPTPTPPHPTHPRKALPWSYGGVDGPDLKAVWTWAFAGAFLFDRPSGLDAYIAH